MITGNEKIKVFKQSIKLTNTEEATIYTLSLLKLPFAQAVAKQMIKQEESGSVLFMYSITRHQAHISLAANDISKAALEMLAKTSHRCITF